MAEFSLFPEHEVFKNLKIDKVLLSNNYVGLINLACNDTEYFYMVCDSSDFHIKDLTYIDWALLPMGKNLYDDFMTSVEKDFKNVSLIFDLVFNNPLPIYYSHKDFKDSTKDYVKLLRLTEESEDTYTFMKLYRKLKNTPNFVPFPV